MFTSGQKPVLRPQDNTARTPHYDANSTKLRQLRLLLSSSRRSMKFVSGAKNDSIVLFRRRGAAGRRGGERDDSDAGAGSTMSSSSARTSMRLPLSVSPSVEFVAVEMLRLKPVSSPSPSSSSSSSLMFMKVRRRAGRPSSAASAAERLRWRVWCEAVDGRRGASEGGADCLSVDDDEGVEDGDGVNDDGDGEHRDDGERRDGVKTDGDGDAEGAKEK